MAWCVGGGPETGRHPLVYDITSKGATLEVRKMESFDAYLVSNLDIVPYFSFVLVELENFSGGCIMAVDYVNIKLHGMIWKSGQSRHNRTSTLHRTYHTT